MFDQYPEETEQSPPFNQQAEEAVLGSIILDRSLIGPVSGIIGPEDFYVGKNAAVFASMLRLHNGDTPVDYLLILDDLERHGKLAEAGGLLYLSSLLGAVPSPIHVLEYAAIVSRCSAMRRLISVAGRIATVGWQDRVEPEEAVSFAEAEIRTVLGSRQQRGPIPMGEAMQSFMDELRDVQEGRQSSDTVPTGMAALDRLLVGGMRRSDLVVLAARTSMGKTAAAIHMAAEISSERNGQQGSALIFSLEMPYKQIVARLLVRESRVDLGTIRSGQYSDSEVRRIGAGISSVANMSIWVDDSEGLTVTQIRDRARRLHAQEPLDMIVVDHLQLISTGGRTDNRAQEVAEITRQLKNMARELSVTVVLLSQLNREVERRSNKIPTLADLRDSGSIEQDADIVLFLYRDDYYDPDSEKQGIVDVHVAKHRNGPLGQVSLIFEDRTMTYLDIEGSY